MHIAVTDASAEAVRMPSLATSRAKESSTKSTLDAYSDASIAGHSLVPLKTCSTSLRSARKVANH
jgi:hypothetical protein